MVRRELDVAQDECLYSIDRVSKMLHTIVVWSNLFYIVAGIIALYTRHKIFGFILLLSGIISIVYHSGWHVFGITNQTWDKIDVGTAIIGTITLLIYGVIILIQNHANDIYNTTRSNIIIFAFVILTILTLVVFAIATFVNEGNKDPHIGIIGPIIAGPQSDQERDDLCRERKRQITYLVYHSIWHILSAMIALFYVTLITID